MGRQFEQEYRQTLESLAFTEEQKAAIAARAVQTAQQEKRTARRSRRPLGRIAAIAACLAVVLAVGASAAGVLPAPVDVFAPLFGGSVAQTEVIDKIGHPIGASDTDNGITISADAIMGDEYNAVIVYTISRDDGERFLPEGKTLENTGLMIGGFGGSAWSRSGGQGMAWFVDQDPDDNRVQYVEAMSVTDEPLTHANATAEFHDLTYLDPEMESEAALYKGHWKFRYEVDFEDCGVRLGSGEGKTFSQDGLNFTIDEISLSPIAMRAAYTADKAAVWSDSGSGRLSEQDARESARFAENVEILLTKTDGTVVDLTNSGSSISPDEDADVSHCTKGQVFDEIIPLEDMESISVGGVVFPIEG